MTYLDANASERPRPTAVAAATAALRLHGNPSSVHAAGRSARRVLEDARECIARCFGAEPAGVVFTSGGTEADALAVHGAGRRVLIGATEHDAIRGASPAATQIPVDTRGVVDLDALRRLLAGPPALVCLMLANNETGVVHPIVEAGRICREAGAILHVDAVQAAGRVPVDLARSGADSMAISAHKLGGPAGAGALLLAPGVALRALMAGGGQERGRRGGAPALSAIAGFAAAAVEATRAPAPHLGALRDAIETAACTAGAVALGAGAPRLDNTTCLALPGVRADTQVMALDLAGFQVSAGAACSSGKVAESHVLRAMGVGALAGQAIRVSLPWNATAEAVQAFIAAYQDMAAHLSRVTA